jgi:kinesin family protein 11
VQTSYSSIGEHLSTSFERVQALENDVSTQQSTLKETLSSLSADATIRAPLHELRETIGAQNLIEYNPTGQTPQRVNYHIPSNLPRTEDHETILSRLRDRPTSSDDTIRSPTKQPIFIDATSSADSTTELFPPAKPDFARSISAHAQNHTAPISLRELDVNIVAQESAHTQPLPLVSRSSDSVVMAAPPNKKFKGSEEGSKLPMKKMLRKTVGGGKDERENLSITNFSNSIGPGQVGGRRLRSHGSS